MLMRQMQQSANFAAGSATGGAKSRPGQCDAARRAAASAANQAEIEKTLPKPSIEQVLDFLHDHRARAFVLDIETDSTIMADENAEKQRRTEFVTALAGIIAAARANDRGRSAPPGVRRHLEVLDLGLPRQPLGSTIRSTDMSSGSSRLGRADKGATIRRRQPTRRHCRSSSSSKSRSWTESGRRRVAAGRAADERPARKMKIQSQQQIEFAKLQSKHERRRG